MSIAVYRRDVATEKEKSPLRLALHANEIDVAALTKLIGEANENELDEIAADPVVWRDVVAQVERRGGDDGAALWHALSIALARGVGAADTVLGLLRESTTARALAKLPPMTDEHRDELLACDGADDRLLLALVSAQPMSASSWNWLVSESVAWEEGAALPPSLLRQIDSVSMLAMLMEATRERGGHWRSLVPLWRLSRRRQGVLSSSDGAQWHCEPPAVDAAYANTVCALCFVANNR